MVDRTPASSGYGAQSLALWSAVLDLVVGTATFLAATQLSAAPDDGTLDLPRNGVLLLALTGPFVLALASLRLRLPATQRVVWLIAGLLALGVGGIMIFRGGSLPDRGWRGADFRMVDSPLS